MGESAISWTNHTNNVVTGCSHASPGCKFCYAEVLSLKKGWSLAPWTARNAEINVTLHPKRIAEYHRLDRLAARQGRAIHVFTCSMGDLFHPLVPFGFLDEVFDAMEATTRLRHQILTKRPERMAEFFERRYCGMLGPDHIWAGTSIENQKWAAIRMPQLLRVAAPIRWISAEPLLGPIDFEPWLWDDPETPSDCISQIIVGGESGLHLADPKWKHRWMDHAWARQIRDACVAAGVSFWFKQSSALRTEVGPQLIEEDGTKTTWQQMPGGAQVRVPVQASLFS